MFLSVCVELARHSTPEIWGTLVSRRLGGVNQCVDIRGRFSVGPLLISRDPSLKVSMVNRLVERDF